MGVRSSRSNHHVVGSNHERERNLVASLSFFDDADEEPQPRLLLDLHWNRVKKDLLTWVSELLPE